MLKRQAIFQDGSVGMEFMTDDSSEAALKIRSLYSASPKSHDKRSSAL
jgi:hypothetical protein